MEAIPTEIDAEHKATLAQARKNANVCLLQVDRGTSHAFLTKLIDNRVLDALRAELCVPHIGAAPRKVDQQRTGGCEVRCPVDLPGRFIEFVSRVCLRRTQLKDDAIRHAAPEAGAIRQPQPTLKGDTHGPLDDLLRPETLKLLRQIDPDTRRAGGKKCVGHSAWPPDSIK